MKSGITAAVIVSDLHAGCQFGLCPRKGVAIDGGGIYHASKPQCKVWDHWRHLWSDVVPEWVKGKRWALVINGDWIDHRHHGSVTQISQDIADQQRIGLECMRHALDRVSPAAVYVVRGTEAHAGPSGEAEEAMAAHLGARRVGGNHSAPELWLRVGTGLAHITHTIGTTASPAYETTALCREYVDAAT